MERIRSCRDTTRKAKPLLELNLAEQVKETKAFLSVLMVKGRLEIMWFHY